LKSPQRLDPKLNKEYEDAQRKRKEVMKRPWYNPEKWVGLPWPDRIGEVMFDLLCIMFMVMTIGSMVWVGYKFLTGGF